MGDERWASSALVFNPFLLVDLTSSSLLLFVLLLLCSYSVEEEFYLAAGFFNKADVLVDMSCGSGLFTRRFDKSSLYKRVIAWDYSLSMLYETRRRLEAERTLRPVYREEKDEGLDLVRCDVEAIPMFDESVDAVHAAAAMHW